jgi:hypothetical protein
MRLVRTRRLGRGCQKPMYIVELIYSIVREEEGRIRGCPTCEKLIQLMRLAVPAVVGNSRPRSRRQRPASQGQKRQQHADTTCSCQLSYVTANYAAVNVGGARVVQVT